MPDNMENGVVLHLTGSIAPACASSKGGTGSMPYAVKTIAVQLQSWLWQVSAMRDTLPLPPPLLLQVPSPPPLRLALLLSHVEPLVVLLSLRSAWSLRGIGRRV